MDPVCKVALVTEGATKVGFATAQELLCQGVESVFLTGTDCDAGRRAASLLSAQQGQDKATFLPADTSCDGQFKDVFKEVIARVGGVDIMFNNPQVLSNRGCWEHNVDVVLKNIFRGTMLALEFMGRDRGFCGGVVVNNAAVEGLQPFPPSPAHCAAEHGIIGATRSFGDHFVKSGVRIVGLCCGHTDSEQSKGGGGSDPQQSSKAAGKAVLHLVRRAAPGSIWIIDSGELFLTEIPHRQSISKLTAKYV